MCWFILGPNYILNQGQDDQGYPESRRIGDKSETNLALYVV